MDGAAESLDTSQQPNPLISTESQGGLGGLPIVDPRTSGQDLRLLRAATRWNVKPELRVKILDTMEEIISNPEDEARDRIGAAKVVQAAIAMDHKQDTAEIEKDKPPASVNVQTNVQVNNGPQLELTVADIAARIAALLTGIPAKDDNAGANVGNRNDEPGEPPGIVEAPEVTGPQSLGAPAGSTNNGVPYAG